MTVINKFHNWQRCGWNWRKPPYESCAPNLISIKDYLVQRWGGQSVGCHVNREVRSGGSVSSHAFGAALDWRYQNPGPCRDTMLNEVLPFLIGQSAELGVQSLHDYVGCRIWRPPGHSGRPPGGAGWQKQRKSKKGNMGKSSALWIHIETHPDHFADSSPVAGRLTGDAGSITAPMDEETKEVLRALPPVDLENFVFGLWPIVPKVMMKRGHRHSGNTKDMLKYAQAVLKKNGLYTKGIDGDFGGGTEAAVAAFQSSKGLARDGIIGTKETWPAIDQSS